MPNIVGIVEAKRKDGCGFLLDDGQWYGIFPKRKEELDPIQKGSCLTVAYTQKGPYRNIQTVSLMNPEEAIAQGKVPSTISTSVAKKSYGRSFPMDPLSPERSIVRQNAMARSMELHIARGIKATVKDEELEASLEKWARFVESYATGDMDRHRAELKMKAMVESSEEDDVDPEE